MYVLAATFKTDGLNSCKQELLMDLYILDHRGEKLFDKNPLKNAITSNLQDRYS